MDVAMTISGGFPTSCTKPNKNVLQDNTTKQQF
jgi:hypothetical protein